MTPLITDIIILALLFLSAIIAFMRGFIKEVLTIFSLLGALAAAYIWGGSAAPVFEKWGVSLAGGKDEAIWGMISPSLFGTILGYASIFVGLFIVLTLLSHYIGKIAQDMGLGSVDRTLGFVFGLARGIFILALLNIPILLLIDKQDRPDWLAEARTMPVINYSSKAILAMKNEPADPPKAIRKIEGPEDTTGRDKPGYEQDNREALDQLIEKVDEQ